MIKANYHTHTARCGHAIGTDEEYVQAAIQAGLTTLGFSDHAAYPTPCPGLRMNIEQIPDYYQSIRSLQDKYAPQIDIHLGMEVEYYPSQWDTIREYRKTLDYIILGQHNLTIDKDSVYEFDNKDQVGRYVTCLEEACQHYMCDYIAHPDVFLWKYPRIDESVLNAAEKIADISRYYDIPLELNCGTGVRIGKKEYLDGERYAYLTREFFEIFAKKKCPIIIGLDIHNPQHFLTEENLNRALSVVEGLPLNFLTDYDLVSKAKERKKLFW